MQNPIVKTEPSFDVTILAGTKSPNIIAQYAMHVGLIGFLVIAAGAAAGGF